MPTVHDVRQYWEANPLLTHEFDHKDEAAYFDNLDRAKRHDSDRFSMRYWEFDRFAGRRVLDIGCGPGWLTVNYARGGAVVASLDLTRAATRLAQSHLRHRGASAWLSQASAEQLPFSDNTFDLVVSSGVLHHTPDTPRALSEACRVLKPGGRAKITLYHLGLLHSRPLFPFVRLAMRLSGVRHPGADLAESSGIEDFVRRYDGDGNPVGVAMTTCNWSDSLRRAGFVVTGHELHYFPKRFLPFARLVPMPAHFLLDRMVGTMIYFELTKR